MTGSVKIGVGSFKDTDKQLNGVTMYVGDEGYGTHLTISSNVARFYAKQLMFAADFIDGVVQQEEIQEDENI